MDLVTTGGYERLLDQISATYSQGQGRASQAVNKELIETYWQVGRYIVEFEQSGNLRAEYGKALIDQLSTDLRLRHGKGFSRSNMIYMRLLYLRYPISQKPSDLLSWSHYVELLRLDDDLERSFYEKQAIAERWSVPELKRQKASSLFLRLAASKDKAGILQLAAQGQVVQQPADLLREPYIFEFLKIPEPHQASESDLETENAVKPQIWVAVAVYVLVAILRKRIALDASLYEILQVLSVNLFEQTPILQAFHCNDPPEKLDRFSNQLILPDL